MLQKEIRNRKIISLYKRSNRGYKKLADEFGITKYTVRDIIKGYNLGGGKRAKKQVVDNPLDSGEKKE